MKIPFKYILIMLCPMLLSQCNVQRGMQSDLPAAPGDYDRSASNSSKRPQGRPGECYAKCLIPDLIEEHSDYYFKYTGEDVADNDNVKVVEIELSPGGKKWVKKRSNVNCRSANPDDCLVWCLVDVPAEYLVLPLVLDTSLTNQYTIEEVTKEIVTEAGGYTEWRRVVCQNQLSEDLISQVHMALISEGYDPGDPSKFRLGSKMKSALTEFQKDNHLPVGQLDYETLEALGLSQ